MLAALSGMQSLLLLDEPTYGQDLRSTYTIMNLLEKKVINEGLTVIFSTHDENLAKAWADEVFEIRKGTLIRCS